MAVSFQRPTPKAIYMQFIATSAEVTPKGTLVRESDPQNGRNIQVKDLFHKLPRYDSAILQASEDVINCTALGPKSSPCDPVATGLFGGINATRRTK